MLREQLHKLGLYFLSQNIIMLCAIARETRGFYTFFAITFSCHLEVMLHYGNLDKMVC